MKVRFEGTYDGQTMKKDGLVTLRFRVPSLHLPEVVKTVMMIEKRIAAQVEAGDQKHKIGIVAFGGLNIDRHGEAKLTLDTDVMSSSVPNEVIQSMIDKSVVVTLVSKVGNAEGEKEDG